ncbi:MAG: hypothetical protein C5B52_08755 [Bacteroidetes bacterium]|nr:MAG: hypothetical protein C5B52_08755 [Bacteroidota bacterium]
MESIGIQQQFFNHLKSILPSHLSLADAMGDLLNLSADSVYRRIRGEKELSLGELKILCEHFHVSLDQVLQMKNNTIVFHAPEFDQSEHNFGDYLQRMLNQLTYINSFKKKEFLYSAKDIFVIHSFHVKELAAFKIFFWSKSIMNNPDLKDRYFSIRDYPFDDYFLLGQKVIKEYNEMPSSEVWNFETMSSTIHQIEYYRDAGLFKTKEDLHAVVDATDIMLTHIQNQAEKGHKYMYGHGEAGHRMPVKYYIQDLILGNNSALVEIDGKYLSYLNHGVLHYLITSDERFNSRANSSFHTLLSRSTLISQTSEKERSRFFRTLREKVQACKNGSL